MINTLELAPERFHINRCVVVVGNVAGRRGEVVEDLRHGAGVGAAGGTATGAAIVRRVVRVVQAVGAVADQQDEGGEAA